LRSLLDLVQARSPTCIAVGGLHRDGYYQTLICF
jgi:hypothetical protein